MYKLSKKLLVLCLVWLTLGFSVASYAETIPPENKAALKQFNDLLVNYFKDNCKGENYTATCPILNDLTPNGKFTTEVAKDYMKNYHYFVFNDKWIWVGHGLFKKLIGKNHENFQGADSKYFAQGFRKFVDANNQGYYPYEEAKVFSGYKNIAYLHRLIFKDGSELIFGTCYNTPVNLIDKKVLADLKSEN